MKAVDKRCPINNACLLWLSAGNHTPWIPTLNSYFRKEIQNADQILEEILRQFIMLGRTQRHMDREEITDLS